MSTDCIPKIFVYPKKGYTFFIGILNLKKGIQLGRIWVEYKNVYAKEGIFSVHKIPLNTQTIPF